MELTTLSPIQGQIPGGEHGNCSFYKFARSAISSAL